MAEQAAASDMLVVNNSGMGNFLEPVKPDCNKWEVYQRRLEQSFIANYISVDAKKMAILLTALGGEVCDLQWDLFCPEDPFDSAVSYGETLNKLSQHFVPTKIEIA